MWHDRLNFLLKLYDQRRAVGISPAMGFKYSPNVDIFEVDSDKPAEEIPVDKQIISIPKEVLHSDNTKIKRLVHAFKE